jgi:HK97 family phage major capsid protein
METKAEINGASGDVIVEAVHDLCTTFEEFKQTNDLRLKDLEEKGVGDILSEEKLARINKALSEQKNAIDRLSLQAARPKRGDARAVTSGDNEHKSAFNAYMRSGDSAGLFALEGKSLSVGVDSDGGYLAPDETEARIITAVRDVSPIRQIAMTRQIGANSYRKPVSVTGSAAGWVGESDARPETTSPTLQAVDFPTMELYAMPAATQTLLDDSIVDIEQWIADEVQAEFAAQESAAFVNGDGLTQPKGLATYPNVAEGTQSWGSLGYIATGVDGGFAATDPGDSLMDLIYAPKQAYRNNGKFLMNRTTLGELRKLKDANGNYLWQPSLQAGVPSTLLGFPVIESEDMAGIGIGSLSIAFGDFERGYLIVDRAGVRVLRDPFSAKPYVLFYTTKRVGGGVQDFEAIKFLKFSVS